MSQVLRLLNEELALTMTLAGCAQLRDITPDLLFGDPMFRAVRLDGDRAAWRPAPNPECP